LISNKANDFVIGLDISTSCTGISLLNTDGSVILLSYYKPAGNSLVEKARGFGEYLDTLLLENSLCSPSFIFIEENLQRFRRGFSSAKVINKLARFNGMLSYIVFERYAVQPVYINVNEGRKSVGLKIPRGSDTKEKVLEWCQENYTNISWPTKKLASGPRRGLVILDPCCYDMADALVTATAGLKLNDIS